MEVEIEDLNLQEYEEFIGELIQAIYSSNGDRGLVYQLFLARLDKLNENFGEIIYRWIKNLLFNLPPEEHYNLGVFIIKFGNLIYDFPFGNRKINLEIGIKAYQSALEIFTCSAFPSEWAKTQYNLGYAYTYRMNGQRTENLEIAIASYHEALAVFSCEAFPVEWASIQNNLGVAYANRIKGEQAENLEVAISCYKESLKVRTRESFPVDWAEAQYNLGLAYSQRIEEEQAENLETAIACYQAALEVFSREAFPVGWAKTQNNLGNAYVNRIEGKEAGNLETAIAYFQAALEVFSHEEFPAERAKTQQNLGVTYRNRIEGEQAANLETAIACSQAALEVFTHETYPTDWARTQYSLGHTFRERFKLFGKAEDIQQAIAAYKRAIEVIQETEDKELLPNYLYLLGKALFEGGYYTEAIENFQVCEQIYQNRKDIVNLALTLFELSRLYHRTGRLETARLYFKDSLRLFRRLEDEDKIAAATTALGNLELQMGKLSQGLNHLKEAQEYYQEKDEPERLEEVNYLLELLQHA
jgi:tetratricopeptide (TPR) repeat protein